MLSDLHQQPIDTCALTNRTFCKCEEKICCNFFPCRILGFIDSVSGIPDNLMCQLVESCWCDELTYFFDGEIGVSIEYLEIDVAVAVGR